MTANYVNLTVDVFDGQGHSPLQGAAMFVPTALLTDSTDHQIITQQPVVVSFQGDALPPAVRLLATDNTGPQPAGWAWSVVFTGFTGAPSGWNFFLPFAGGASQNLSALSPVSSVVTMQAYMPLPTGTPVSGQVPVATGAGEASAWGTVLANPMTTLGDLITGGSAGAPARLGGNTTSTREFLRSTGTGSAANAPAWDTLTAGDIPALPYVPTSSLPLAIASGGTGQASQQAAINALTGTQVSGRYVRSDGTNSALSTIQAGDVPVLNQNTTGTAANVTGTVAVANGGTGQITQPAALTALTGAQTAGRYVRSDGANSALAAIQAADLPAATGSTQGAVILNSAAATITAPGAQSAGASSQAADAAHIHPLVGGWVPSDNALLVANYPLPDAGNTTIAVAGTLYLMKIMIRQAVTISSLWFAISTAGTGSSTGSFCGLYNSSGTLLSGSSDIGTNLTTAGGRQCNLTTPQSLSSGVFVWAALLVNLATTQPTPNRCTGVSVMNTGLTAATFASAINGTGLTSLPGSITPSSNTQSSAITYWVGGS